MNFPIMGPAGLTVTNLAADKPSPQSLGLAVLFTAAASGGTAPLQFKWWVFDGSVWSVAQDWSTSNSFNWIPAAGGDYIIGVWARSSGNTADAAENAIGVRNFAITAPDVSLVHAFAEVPYTIHITASQGYSWFATPGNLLKYQPVALPLSVTSWLKRLAPA
jgi:hypothetical protein